MIQHFITHYFPEGIPKRGFRKLSVITQTNESDEEYFLGTDNNPQEPALINGWVNTQKVLPLPEKTELPDEETSLWIDPAGDLYFAHCHLGENDDKKRLLFTSDQLKQNCKQT